MEHLLSHVARSIRLYEYVREKNAELQLNCDVLNRPFSGTWRVTASELRRAQSSIFRDQTHDYI